MAVRLQQKTIATCEEINDSIYLCMRWSKVDVLYRRMKAPKMRFGKLGFRYFIVSLWLRTLFSPFDGVEAENKVRVFIVSAVYYKTCT